VPPQPNAYGQQPGPYGQQPYGVPQPPAAGGGGKKTAVIIGAVAVVAAIAVGAYFLIGGGGGGSVADDGPHKLIAPAAVINGTYAKNADAGSSDTMTDSDRSDFEKWGVSNPQQVTGVYDSGTGLTKKGLNFKGVYGTIKDPEAVVDAMFAKAKAGSEKNQSGDSGFQGKLIGSPQTVNPSGLSNAVMKCQVAQLDTSGSAQSGVPKTVKMPVCIWGDHSTVGLVTAYSVASIASGDGGTVDDTASLAAKLRNDVRVKA
jgi:hypothetical protein